MNDHIVNTSDSQPLSDQKNTPLMTLISAADSDLDAFTWRISEAGYVMRRVGKKRIFLHRVIMSRALGRDLLDDEFVDHIDQCRLNNTRSNLRLATRTQNNLNRKATRKSKTGYKGVCQVGSYDIWVASISVNKKRITLGRFKTPELAAQAYNEAAREYFGEFAWLNEIPGMPNSPIQDSQGSSQVISLPIVRFVKGHKAPTSRIQALHKAPARSDSTSGYKGVMWHKAANKWYAAIKVNQKSIYLGLFTDVLEAARAYNAAALLYHGENAYQNAIPEDPASMNGGDK